MEAPRDLFEQEISIGDYVVGGQGHELGIYRVTKLTPKMIRIVSIKAKTDKQKKGKLRYSNELLRVDSKMVTFYILKEKG